MGPRGTKPIDALHEIPQHHSKILTILVGYGHLISRCNYLFGVSKVAQSPQTELLIKSVGVTGHLVQTGVPNDDWSAGHHEGAHLRRREGRSRGPNQGASTPVY